MLKEFVGDLF